MDPRPTPSADTLRVEQDHDPTVQLSSIPAPAAIVGREHLDVRAVNDAFSRMFGVTDATLVGRSLAEMLPPSQIDLVTGAALRAALRPTRVDTVLRTPRGARRGDLSISVLGEEASELLLLYLDHTPAASTDASRATAAAAADQLRIQLASHLTLVSSFARLLTESGDDLDEDTRDRLRARVASAAGNAATLVEDLGEGPVADAPASPTAVGDVVAWLEGLAALAFEARDGILVTDIGDEIVDVDAGVFRQILLHLVNNALAHAAPVGPLRVHIATRRVADGLEVIVTDNGRGIPAERVDDVLSLRSPGPSTHRAHGTSLAACRSMADEIGGWLSAVPHDGGARFVLWLPVHV